MDDYAVIKGKEIGTLDGQVFHCISAEHLLLSQ